MDLGIGPGVVSGLKVALRDTFPGAKRLALGWVSMQMTTEAGA